MLVMLAEEDEEDEDAVVGEPVTLDANVEALKLRVARD